MIGQAQTRSIIPRALQTRASRVLRAALRRLPPRVQRLGLRAFTPVMKRWPTVLRLLGLDETSVPASVPPTVASPAAASVARDGGTRAAEVTPPSPDVAERLTASLRDPSAEVAAEAAH